jgi:hypothetical protein
MMDILSKNSKEVYSKSVTELLRTEKERKRKFVQGVCYFIIKVSKII